MYPWKCCTGWFQHLLTYLLFSGKVEKMCCVHTKSMGPCEIHPWVLRELVDEVAKPLSIIFEKFWQSGEVPTEWKRRNTNPVFAKGSKEDLGNHRPVSWSRSCWKLWWDTWNERMVTDTTTSQRSNTAWKTWWVLWWSYRVCGGRATDVTYLNLCKVFSTVKYSILVSKLERNGLDKRNTVDSRAGVKDSSGDHGMSVALQESELGNLVKGTLTSFPVTPSCVGQWMLKRRDTSRGTWAGWREG